MSGTSGDGLDIAHCSFEREDTWSFDLLKVQTVPFPEALGALLMHAHELSGLDLQFLDVQLGKWMGECVKTFCEDLSEKPLAVCSHGHTVFHQPDKGLSLQIGNGYWLAQKSELPAINDFRMKDISLGGQGAPLVPVGDQLLFSDYDFCLNLGGISNISMEVSGERKAFDCTPFNGLLNHFAKVLGAEYDQDGNWAAEGAQNEILLDSLNALAYYKVKGAKSLGREDLEADFLPLLQKSGLPPKNILATLVAHFAFQIGRIIRDFQRNDQPKILVTGGGAYHETFIEKLKTELSAGSVVIVPDQGLLEFKEALIFGFLGVLKMCEENNCLASVTGAKSDSSGGTWYDYRPS